MDTTTVREYKKILSAAITGAATHLDPPFSDALNAAHWDFSHSLDHLFEEVKANQSVAMLATEGTGAELACKKCAESIRALVEGVQGK